MPENTLHHRPQFNRHRKKEGSPVAPDTTDLDLLHNGDATNAPFKRNAINAVGYDSLVGFVLLEAGTNITLQPLEAIKYVEDEVEKERFIPHPDGNIGPLVDGDSFKLDIPGGGKWFFRIDAVTGAVTKAQIYLAAGSRANEGSI